MEENIITTAVETGTEAAVNSIMNGDFLKGFTGGTLFGSLVTLGAVTLVPKAYRGIKNRWFNKKKLEIESMENEIEE
ncbi:MAG: hypothetical protein J6O18_05155 [Bacilli bacterium]|nr:hypothetical protein [Bacilli bacterium]